MKQIAPYRIDWDALPWVAPMPGVRFKAFEQNKRRVRLVEFTREFEEPDWCRKGHLGYVLEGRGELRVGDQTVLLRPGDGVFIPPGEEHRHRLRVLDERMRLVLVEEL